MRTFYLGDILSVTTGRILSYVDGLYDLFEYLTGDDVYTHQLGRVSKECAPWLKQCFPQFDSPKMDFEIAELGEMLKTPSGKKYPDLLVARWLYKMVAEYGEIHEVPKMPSFFHKKIDPIKEMLDLKSLLESGL